MVQASASSEARLKDLEEEYAMFRPPVAAGPVAGAYRSMDPGVNLATDYYDNFSEGYGNLHAAGRVLLPGNAAEARDQFNPLSTC